MAGQEVLLVPIAELPVSAEFLEMSGENNFRTLKDILDTPLYEFTNLPKSGYRMLRELLNVLDQYGLMHLAGK